MPVPGKFIFPMIEVGGSSPDPAVYCPANGYIPDPTIYYPPIAIPDPDPQEIILLCSNASPSVISVKCTTSSGQYTAKVYDAGNNEIYSENKNSNVVFTYYFTVGELAYFTVKLFPATAGQSILTFTAYNAITGYNYDWPILQAKFNTPNITSLASAFRAITQLKDIRFDSTLNYLTSFDSAFYAGGLLKFVFPSGLPLLNTVASMFRDNLSVIEIDMSGATFPELTTMQNMCYSAAGNNLKTFKFPTVELPKVTTIAGVHYRSGVNGDVVIPNMPLLIGASTSFQYTSNLKSLKWNGTFASLAASALDNHIQYSGLHTFYYPRWKNSLSQNIENNNFIKNIVLPDVIVGSNNGGAAWLEQQSYKETVSGDGDNSAMGEIYVAMGQCYNLKSFNCPKLRCSTLQLAGKSVFTYCDIDYANSTFSGGGNIVIQGGLDAAELNRIFTELPPLARNIVVSANPGYAACNPSIATAKGWTVL